MKEPQVEPSGVTLPAPPAPVPPPEKEPWGTMDILGLLGIVLLFISIGALAIGGILADPIASRYGSYGLVLSIAYLIAIAWVAWLLRRSRHARKETAAH